MDSRIICGDCLEVLAEMTDNCVDSIVTDPPAGISFMGKEWDHNKGGRDKWVAWLAGIFKEAIRVLKPGGHAFVWSLPRTSHWTALALEDAGFEIRDCVYHVFGSGFPKSLDISKAIDKAAGAARKVVGRRTDRAATLKCDIRGGRLIGGDRPQIDLSAITAPVTFDARRWNGWHTALKPAVECWWLARKPLSEKTVAANVLKWGTGGLNIDACRIGHNEPEKHAIRTAERTGTALQFNMGKSKSWQENMMASASAQGRFPANLVHDGSAEVLAEFAKTGDRRPAGTVSKRTTADGMFGLGHDGKENVMHNDRGSAARFFYCAKASRAEREAGLEEIKTLFEQIEAMPPVDTGHYAQDEWSRENMGNTPDAERKPVRNDHPTVKPVTLMRYLIRLITPPNGIVLDMFAGSGSTLVAAEQLGFDWLGIEIDEGYCEIIKRRTATFISAVVKTHVVNK